VIDPVVKGEDMVRIIEGRRFYWLMSYIEKSEALEKADRYRRSGKNAMARVTRSRRGFYEVWGARTAPEAS